MAGGSIITFYSYKGGVGRSMTLANVAWVLASNGMRVLIVDWDLESPGLTRYFGPFLDHREVASSSGLIDLLIDYSLRGLSPIKQVPSIKLEPGVEDALSLDDCLLRIGWQFPGGGALDLMSSGRPIPAYASRVTTFSWGNFYAQSAGYTFIENLKAQFRQHYHYVLIDSRTGVSDASGICTIQMPDYLVICFTLNRQSMEGAARVAEAVETQRNAMTNGEPRVAIFPVPTRVRDAAN